MKSIFKPVLILVLLASGAVAQAAAPQDKSLIREIGEQTGVRNPLSEERLIQILDLFEKIRFGSKKDRSAEAAELATTMRVAGMDDDAEMDAFIEALLNSAPPSNLEIDLKIDLIRKKLDMSPDWHSDEVGAGI